MEEHVAALRSNWSRSGGCDFSEAIQTRMADPDIFYKPTLDEILSEEHAVLLSKASLSESNCELCLTIFPHYKIQAFHLVCSAPKAEIFHGTHREYMETVYGTILADASENEGTGEGELCQLIGYRYDIEVHKSGVTHITVKLLGGGDEVCLYGLVVQVAPNPNGTASLLSNSTNIDIENVKQMLEKSKLKLSPGAEKCKLLMEMYSEAAKNSMQPQQSADVSSIAKHLFKQEALKVGASEKSDYRQHNEDILSLRSYISERLTELESRIEMRLSAFEEQQTAKLDQILKILEDLSKSN